MSYLDDYPILLIIQALITAGLANFCGVLISILVVVIFSPLIQSLSKKPIE